MIAEPSLPETSPKSRRRLGLELFLISVLILFFELACIRWFASTVIFLTYFTNVILMACFLGVSAGCLAARRERDHLRGVIPLTVLATAAAVAVLWAYDAYEQVAIDFGGQQSPQQIFFGTDARPSDLRHFVIPVEVVAGTFFLLIALMFVGLGQALGRRFDAVTDRVRAYTINVAGSLAGIFAFAAASWARVPAWAWFAASVAMVLALIPRRSWLQVVGATAAVGCVALADAHRDKKGNAVEVTWSPYYKIEYKPRYRSIDVNNLGHQGMLPVERAGPAYVLPHLLNRDAGGRPFADVLILGAGSGNDVQAALAYGAERIDAVEIDPVILELGRAHHPDRPYRNPRVVPHLDDGRHFLRTTPRTYDLVSYALVDSLVLHSSYSSLRLESFLFTEQAFRDAKARLKPGGVFAVYNFYRQGWVVGRLVELAERVFGTKPLVLSLPYQERIHPTDNQKDFITFLLVGAPGSKVVEAIRERFAGGRSFWLNDEPWLNRPINGFEPGPRTAAGRWMRIGPAAVGTVGIGPLPTDDWPFLYLRSAVLPGLNVRGMALVGGLSLALLFALTPVRRVRPDGRMFFLGAGFLLLETKGVVHMALLFGSTWVVNSIVFAAVLVMVLLGNLFVAWVRPRAATLPLYSALLIAALGINLVVPMTTFLALPGTARVVASCAVVFLPVFFAGILFATSFRDCPRPGVALGSNIAGAILGGLSENVAVLVGFNQVLVLAIVYYLLAAVLGPRSA